MQRHRIVRTIPQASPNQRVGLFGGSFNPVHSGHVHMAHTALKQAHLDWVWVLVTPQNPQKSNQHTAPIDERAQSVANAMSHPRIITTTCEQEFRTTYTIDTIKKLQLLRPHLNFFWIMGADSFRNFHTWKQADQIACALPIIMMNRPGYTLKALNSKTARKWPEKNKAELAQSPLAPPVWIPLLTKNHNISSTELRNIKKQINHVNN